MLFSLYCFILSAFSAEPKEISPLDQTRMLGLSLLQENGFEAELNKSAIRGMLKYIDDQLGYGVSQLMTVEEKDRLLEYQNGIREGYGVRIQLIERKGFLVEHIFQDGAAYQTGLRKGDLIISVGNQTLMGKQSNEMVRILNMKSQGEVRFEVLRNGHLISFFITRGSYQLHPISVYNNVVQIHYFTPDTKEKLKETLQERKLSSLILDLRNNEGGSIEQVQMVMGLFLPNILMGYRYSVEGTYEEIRSLGDEKFEFDGPVYVLINKQTAYAGELFASSMLLHKRAILVGERSAGLAYESHFYPLNKNLFLYVADTKLLNLGKTSWDGVGVQPSIVVRSSQSIVGGREIDVQLETVLRLLKSP